MKPRLISSIDSYYSGKINIWEEDGGLILEVGGYPQSVSLSTSSLSERYWSKATQIVSQHLINPEKALFVGVGGGTILHLLGKNFPALKMVGVELDPEIIKVARQFFDLDEILNLEVVEGDGNAYVFNYQGTPFDLVYIDAYLGGNFPLHFEEQDFLKRLGEITNPGGWVVINRASGFPQREFEQLLRQVFATVEVVRIPLPGFLGGMAGNYLYLCKSQTA